MTDPDGPGPEEPTEQPEVEAPTSSPALDNLLHNFERFQSEMVQPSDADAGQEDAEPTAESVVRSIDRSVALLTTLSGTIAAANQLGVQSENRPADDAAHLVALVVQGLSEKPTDKRNDSEKIFLHLYGKAHNDRVVLPGWMASIQSAVNIDVKSDRIPDVEEFDSSIPASEETAKQLAAECRRLKAKYMELRQKNDDGSGKVGPGGDDTLKAQQRLGNKRRELARELGNLQIDPVKVPECSDEVSFTLSPTPEHIETLVAYQRELGKLIVELTREEDGEASPDIELSRVAAITKSEAFPKLEGVELDALPGLSTVPKAQLRKALPQIAASYVSLREAVLQAHLLHSRAPGPADPDSGRFHTAAGAAIKNSLNSVFPKSDNEVITALMKLKDPRVDKETLQDLLFAQVTGRHDSETLFIAQKNSNIFLPEAMRAILDDDERAITQLKRGPSDFQKFVDFGMQMKRVMEGGEPRDFVEFLDRKLEIFTSSGDAVRVPYEERMALLVGLSAVSQNPNIMRLMKAQLRNKELIPELAKKLSEDIHSKGSVSGSFIEQQRLLLDRRFSPSLDDYWGKNKLKDRFRRLIEEHLLLLENPQAWEGLESKTVFKNGHLLIGDPGAGKGHFVACAANEYGLHVETVTREQLENVAKENAKKASEKDPKQQISDTELESAYADFLDQRIRAAREQMKVLGSVASIVFIDEMEAEFLKRDTSTSDQQELNRTNIMLRVIEKKISENPDIIFMGATNNITQVDPAAYRVGRYGEPWVVGGTDKQDVQSILSGTFTELGVQHDEYEVEEPAAEETSREKNKGKTVIELHKIFNDSCEGLTPLTIRQLVNNTICVLRARDGEEYTTLDENVMHELIDRLAEQKARFSERDALFKTDNDMPKAESA